MKDTKRGLYEDCPGCADLRAELARLRGLCREAVRLIDGKCEFEDGYSRGLELLDAAGKEGKK